MPWKGDCTMSEPIRVLHVVTHMNRGGLETMLMNYDRHMDRDRVQFDFLTHREAAGDYDEEISSLGGRIYHVPRLIPWSHSYRKSLDDFFTTHPEYRIVHVHQDCLSTVALQEAQRCGVPVRIAHSHNASQDKNFKYPIKLFYRNRIPKHATDLFACSEEAGRWMFQGARFTVVRNAIDAGTYTYDPAVAAEVRREWGIASDVLTVGHVGRFCSVKNHTFLLDVFAELVRIQPSAVLLLVGVGELRTQMEEKTRALGLSDRVIFTGLRGDVNRLMQAMDVFVFPSLYEGLPVTLVEAQAAGLPCVVSDRVSAECAITKGLVTVMPLSRSAGDWAGHILKEAASAVRKDRTQEIKTSGYDITYNARKLEDFYLGKYRQTCTDTDCFHTGL